MISKANQQRVVILLVAVGVLFSMTIWSLLYKQTSKPSEKQLVLKSSGNETIVAIDTTRKSTPRKVKSGKEPIFKLIPPPEPPVELAHVDSSETKEPDPSAFTLVDKEPMPIKISECLSNLTLPNSEEKCMLSGSVFIRVLVDTNGQCVKSFLLRASNSCLSEAVHRLVPCFRFTPAYLNEKPVQAWVTVPYCILTK